jgi:hypothetical protein
MQKPETIKQLRSIDAKTRNHKTIKMRNFDVVQYCLDNPQVELGEMLKAKERLELDTQSKLITQEIIEKLKKNL